MLAVLAGNFLDILGCMNARMIAKGFGSLLTEMNEAHLGMDVAVGMSVPCHCSILSLLSAHSVSYIQWEVKGKVALKKDH